MDVMGRVFLADGLEVKIVTGIDDHARFIVCAKVVPRMRSGCPKTRRTASPGRGWPAGPGTRPRD